MDEVAWIGFGGDAERSKRGEVLSWTQFTHIAALRLEEAAGGSRKSEVCFSETEAD
jgi:hypothetical protein